MSTTDEHRECSPPPPAIANRSDDNVDEKSDDEEVSEKSGTASGTEKLCASACPITGSGVTLMMLMQEGFITPGDEVLSIEYLGQKFTADLLANGRIKTNDTRRVFNSPSAWAIHCKRLVNPDKKSGCGWASVKYRGKKLDAYKTQWIMKQRAKAKESPATVCSEEDDDDVESQSDDENIDDSMKESNSCGGAGSDRRSSDASVNQAIDLTAVTDAQPKTETEQWDAEEPQEEALNLCIRVPVPVMLKEEKQVEIKQEQRPVIVERKMKKNFVHTGEKRKCVRYSTLGRRSGEHDPKTQVECITFNSIGKAQPFAASMGSNCMMLVDFHCHLTTSEVVGYLGGKFEPSTQHLSVVQAFPCRCRLGDKESGPAIEHEIRRNMDRRGLSLVGWYHSHPSSSPNPSLRDIDSQMEYQFQLTATGHTYNPCFGLIVSPYEKGVIKNESTFRGFWVFPPPENRPTDYGVPMQTEYFHVHDHLLTQDLLGEMKKLVAFYSGAPDFIDFQDKWQPSVTYLEKLKCSMKKNFPINQSEIEMMETINGLLAK